MNNCPGYPEFLFFYHLAVTEQNTHTQKTQVCRDSNHSGRKSQRRPDYTKLPEDKPMSNLFVSPLPRTEPLSAGLSETLCLSPLWGPRGLFLVLLRSFSRSQKAKRAGTRGGRAGRRGTAGHGVLRAPLALRPHGHRRRPSQH